MVKKKEWIFVIIQFFLFFTFMVPHAYLKFYTNELLISIGIVFVSIGLFIVLIAVLALNRNLRIFPSPKSNSTLITQGVFKFVRHPIYSGILFTVFGFSIYSGSFFRLVVSLCLLLLFYLKSKYEEILLAEKFANYKEYCKKTGRFLPRFW
jgi:protein-S-isoprenylcysteine O-methyltransferase Ste14